MLQIDTEKGEITVSNSVITQIAGAAAMNCFGVKGMAIRSMTDGLVHLLRKEAMGKGVLVHCNEDHTLAIDLHIMVEHGVNIAALSDSIISEVRYVVGQITGAEIAAVHVFVDAVVAG